MWVLLYYLCLRWNENKFYVCITMIKDKNVHDWPTSGVCLLQLEWPNMETAGNNILAHGALPFYQNGLTTSVSSILSSSPGAQDSISRTTSIGAQNGWPSYSTDSSIPPHNSCSMASYGNLQLGPSFSAMNGKSPYNTFASAGADYLNCRQMQLNHMNLNAMPTMRNYPPLYSDMYPSAHSAGYTNGSFYPDIPPGLPTLPGRDIDCRSATSESSNQGNIINGITLKSIYKIH